MVSGLLKKHRQKVLVVFGILMMLLFVISTAVPMATRDQGEGPVEGLLGGEKIRMARLQRAAQEWEVVSRGPLFLRDGESVRTVDANLASVHLGVNAARMITPLSFMLLTHEAQRMQVRPAEQEIIENLQLVNYGGNPQDGGLLELRRAAVAHLLMVREAWRQVSQTVKVSNAMVQNRSAMMGQQITFYHMPFTVADHWPRAADASTQPTTGPTTRPSTVSPGRCSRPRRRWRRTWASTAPARTS